MTDAKPGRGGTSDSDPTAPDPSSATPQEGQSGLAPCNLSGSSSSSQSIHSCKTSSSSSPDPRSTNSSMDNNSLGRHQSSSSSESASSAPAAESPMPATAVYFSPSKRESAQPTLSISHPRSLPHGPILRPDISPLSKVRRTRQRIYPLALLGPASTSHLRSDSSFLPLFPPYYSSPSVSSVRSYSTATLDSKYPSALHMPDLGIIPFDVLMHDEEGLPDEPKGKESQSKGLGISWRGVGNMVSLLLLISAILALFVIFPVISVYQNVGLNSAIASNLHINASGQAELNARDQLPFPFELSPIDNETPSDVFTRWGRNGAEYELVFSDEFETGQDRGVWLLGDDDPTPTLRNGHLMLKTSLRTRSPFCLSHGLVEVAFIKGQERWRAYWTGDWNIVSEADALTFLDRIPAATILRQQQLVMLHMGFDNLSRRSQVAVDFIRLYQLKTNSNQCDEALADYVTPYLDFDQVL